MFTPGLLIIYIQEQKQNPNLMISTPRKDERTQKYYFFITKILIKLLKNNFLLNK